MQAVTVNDLYRQLPQEDLRRVAGACSLDLEDVRQEAMMICQEVAAGASDYDLARGTIAQYVMGRLWGMTLRWQNPVFVAGNEGDEEGERLFRALLECSPVRHEAEDPLAILEAVEKEREHQQRRKRVLEGMREGERTFVALLLQGLPLESLAELYGLTPRAVRYRMAGVVALREGVPAC